MSQQEVVGNPQALKNLAAMLREHVQEEPKAPAVTDRHILCAMLGKPWWSPKRDDAATEIRKAG